MASPLRGAQRKLKRQTSNAKGKLYSRIEVGRRVGDLSLARCFDSASSSLLSRRCACRPQLNSASMSSGNRKISRHLRASAWRLVTNQTGVGFLRDQDAAASCAKRGMSGSSRFFLPKHGIDGTVLAGKSVASREDSLTGLAGRFALRPDAQADAGDAPGDRRARVRACRTLARAATPTSPRWRPLEACGEAKIPFVVLDGQESARRNARRGSRHGEAMAEFRRTVPRAVRARNASAGELAQDGRSPSGWMGSRCQLTVIPMRAGRAT